MDDIVPSKLLNDLSIAVSVINRHDYIQVYSHYDADGISSAAIIANALRRAKKEFKVTLFTTLNDDVMDIIRRQASECTILSDLGASYIGELGELDSEVIVLDHHTVQDVSDKVCYVNPHLYGIDGMTDGCGATVSLLFAVTMNEGNWDLVQLAFAGIAGDQQEKNGVTGLNVHLLNEGVRRGHIEVIKGSPLPAGDIGRELFLSTYPYISGISGNHDGIGRLMKDLGMSEGTNLMDLTEDERGKLFSLITLMLTRNNVPVDVMARLFRHRYLLKDWNMSADALASILNSCGRNGVGGMGIAAGLGDPDCLKDAQALDESSRMDIMDATLTLESKSLNQMENIQWFDSSTSGYTGIICEIAMSYLGDPNKPTIGVNVSEDHAKISSRATDGLLERGVDLSKAMSEACASVNGKGGGHRIASGGSCPSNRVDEFLDNLNRIVGSQIRPSM